MATISLSATTYAWPTDVLYASLSHAYPANGHQLATKRPVFGAV